MNNSQKESVMSNIQKGYEKLFIIFGNIFTEKTKVISLLRDKKLSSMSRFSRKIKYNKYKWHWWITLTFADNKEPTQVDHFKFTPKETLASVKEFGFSEYIRGVLNTLRTYLKKPTKIRKPVELSYFWVYEQGGKTNRPHFHIGINDIGIESTTNEIKIREFIFKYWKAGNVDAEKINYNKYKITEYLDKYLDKSEGKYDQNTEKRKRFWGTTRDILPVPKKKNITYLGICDVSDESINLKQQIRFDGLKFYLDQDDLERLYKNWSYPKQFVLDDFPKKETIITKLPSWLYMDYIDGQGLVSNPLFKTFKRQKQNLPLIRDKDL